MPVRLRITLLFASLSFIILLFVCSSIYYFSAQARKQVITTRLKNRAITTGRLLNQREIFDEALVRRIDSSTTIALHNKVVLAFDKQNRLVYSYHQPENAIVVDSATLKRARDYGDYYFQQGTKEIVAHHFRGQEDLIIIAGGVDEEGNENLRQLLRILIIALLLGNIVVIISGYIFSKQLLQPIRQIATDVAEISAQNLARRIETGSTRDEWFHLSDTLNKLLNRLQESFELQRRFISNASHELSTPLTSISSQLQVTLQRDRTADEYRKTLQSVYEDVQHMNKLTQTLLEFAKASGSTGGLEIDLLRVDEILLAMPAQLSKINSSYVVKLTFESLPEDEDQLLVFGNEPLLTSAIKNIVVNACKYSSNHIANISLHTIDNQVIVTVSDTGAGIPSGKESEIFQPFYRVDHEKPEGFGLGLSLADRIIKIHKGSIQVQSEEGKGSRFTITLPAASSLQKVTS